MPLFFVSLNLDYASVFGKRTNLYFQFLLFIFTTNGLHYKNIQYYYNYTSIKKRLVVKYFST